MRPDSLQDGAPAAPAAWPEPQGSPWAPRYTTSCERALRAASSCASNPEAGAPGSRAAGSPSALQRRSPAAGDRGRIVKAASLAFVPGRPALTAGIPRAHPRSHQEGALSRRGSLPPSLPWKLLRAGGWSLRQAGLAHRFSPELIATLCLRWAPAQRPACQEFPRVNTCAGHLLWEPGVTRDLASAPSCLMTLGRSKPRCPKSCSPSSRPPHPPWGPFPPRRLTPEGADHRGRTPAAPSIPSRR